MPACSRILGAALGLGLAIFTTIDSVASHEHVVHWRMNSLLYPKVFGEAGERFAETVRRLSSGSFNIEVHDRLVLDQDTFGALDSGLVDAVWGSAGHHHGILAQFQPFFTRFS